MTINCPFCGSSDFERDPDGNEDTYGCHNCHNVFAVDDDAPPMEPENDQTDNLTVVDGKHVGRRKEG
jgi:transposase-like protein